MGQENRRVFDGGPRTRVVAIPRRVVVGGLAMIGLLARAGFGQGENKQAERKESDAKGRKEAQDKMEELTRIFHRGGGF